jgi:hypothetical protein
MNHLYRTKVVVRACESGVKITYHSVYCVSQNEGIALQRVYEHVSERLTHEFTLRINDCVIEEIADLDTVSGFKNDRFIE